MMVTEPPNISGSGSGPGDAGRLSQIQDVISVLLSRGELSKAEIMELWGLDNEGYEELKAGLLRERLLELGPRGKGGFRARFVKRAATPED